MDNIEKYVGKRVTIRLSKEWPTGENSTTGAVTNCQGPQDNEGPCDSLSIKGNMFNYTVFEDEIDKIEVLSNV